MREPTAPYEAMVNPQNRNFLGTFNNKLLAAAQRCIAAGLEYEIPEMIERTLDFMASTAGLDGRAREDLRDALMGARAPVPAVGATPPRQVQRGNVPSLG